MFIDVDAIRLGSRFDDAIVRAVASCDVLIALIGRSWLDASAREGAARLADPEDYVRREIEAAIQEGVVVVPVCVQGARFPARHELPATLVGLTERQGFELRDATWQDDVAGLLRRLGSESVSRGPDAAGSRPRSTRRNRVVLAGACALLVAATIAIVLVLDGPDGGGSTGARASGVADPRLLAAVPAVSRRGCRKASPPEPGAVAAITCDAGSTLTAEYQRFPDAATADAWYVRQQVAAHADTSAERCTQTRFRGSLPYPEGRAFCYRATNGQAGLFALGRNLMGVRVETWADKREASTLLLKLWPCCLRLVH